MTFYTNFSSASKQISFYKRTSSPLRRRRVSLDSQTDDQYEKWCGYLHQPPKKLRVRGRSTIPAGILAGHFISVHSLTDDAEECYEDADLPQELCDANMTFCIPNEDDGKAQRSEVISRDIKQRLLEDIKSYKSRNQKSFKKSGKSRNDPNEEVPDEKECIEKKLKDRLKGLFFKHSDWLKKTINSLKNRDGKCCKRHEKFMGISFCKN
ncbi:unnamed protein product [Acanthoscelides obtectus]|uniref:Uncharacterized protein n=1 Tax=Acanthoscelides obtectus TaxID=200917 RepID=A0A9P0NZX2_ACAOB|nr:unnamed protein product [Acanthoscelides obtectus]CAK1665932.1 hypothetical protein AOBTE_LOCUS25055 [Acanthoscelides obtectus]